MIPGMPFIVPPRMTTEVLEAGYWRAYRDFYRWGAIFRGASTKDKLTERLRHIAYAGGWKKLEPMWDWIIRAKRASNMLPVLETVLTGFGSHPARQSQTPQINDVQPSALDSIITIGQ